MSSCGSQVPLPWAGKLHAERTFRRSCSLRQYCRSGEVVIEASATACCRVVFTARASPGRQGEEGRRYHGTTISTTRATLNYQLVHVRPFAIPIRVHLHCKHRVFHGFIVGALKTVTSPLDPCQTVNLPQ
ncbi:hypothetical protein AUP68_15581 [Ilyonectria robusta]